MLILQSLDLLSERCLGNDLLCLRKQRWIRPERVVEDHDKRWRWSKHELQKENRNQRLKKRICSQMDLSTKARNHQAVDVEQRCKWKIKGAKIDNHKSRIVHYQKQITSQDTAKIYHLICTLNVASLYEHLWLKSTVCASQVQRRSRFWRLSLIKTEYIYCQIR